MLLQNCGRCTAKLHPAAKTVYATLQSQDGARFADIPTNNTMIARGLGEHVEVPAHAVALHNACRLCEEQTVISKRSDNPTVENFDGVTLDEQMNIGVSVGPPIHHKRDELLPGQEQEQGQEDGTPQGDSNHDQAAVSGIEKRSLRLKDGHAIRPQRNNTENLDDGRIYRLKNMVWRRRGSAMRLEEAQILVLPKKHGQDGLKKQE